MSIRLDPASTLDDERLAALFTAVYVGYWHPIQVGAEQFRHMVETYDFDLDASLVALDGDEPVGLAMLAIRGDRGWVGGMGVLPDRRGAGVGTALTHELLANARDRRLSRVRLEVLEQNAPAIAVYRKLGFVDHAEVAVWQLAAPPETSGADPTDLDAALRELGPIAAEAPWQRSAATIERIRTAGTTLFAARAGVASAVFSLTGTSAGLMSIAAQDVDAALALLRAPFERGAESLVFLNGPTAGPVAAALRSAGADALARQYELESRPGA